ncbi:hypothetical protein QOZ80_9BG0698920 [Eleusine coracana subsp. coracana]|nr:hypothetical protein QOZ80_9BG0698920 [Eleusine coracana subsp. coracana]
MELSPSVITGLGQLICLHGSLKYDGTRLPDELKELTSLQVLKNVVLTCGRIAEKLGHLTELTVLEAEVELPTEEASDDERASCSEALLEALGKLMKVECLHIRVHFNEVNLDGSMAKPLGNLRRLYIGISKMVPTWIRAACLPALSYLDIHVAYEQTDDIQLLGTLPCLRRLRYEVMEGAVERCAVGADAFPRLVICVFDIWDVWGGAAVVPCTFPRGAMPMLQDFKFRIGHKQKGSVAIEDCLSLGHLPSLRSVTVLGLYYFEDDDKATKRKVKAVRKKLEQEAAAHPNHPLCIDTTNY